MYKISNYSDKETIPGNLKKEFQGSYLRNCRYMVYWFLWKDYTFDIRQIRKYFGKKQEKSIDFNFNINSCSRFQTQMNEIIELIDKQDFEYILLKIAKQS